MTFGEATLRIAKGEIGHGEEGRNNHGFHINKYRRGYKPLGSGAWCATFISWCLEEAWCALGKKRKHLPELRTNSASRLTKRLEGIGELVEFNDMEPGDILLFDRRGGKHICIVSEVCLADGKVHKYFTIDGNKGKFPAVVKEIEHGVFPKPEKIVRLP